MQRGRERIMNVLFTFLSDSSFLFLFFFFFWEAFECLLLQTITLICVTSFGVIIHSFPKKRAARRRRRLFSNRHSAFTGRGLNITVPK